MATNTRVPWLLLLVILLVPYYASSQSPATDGDASTPWRSAVGERWSQSPSWFKRADQYMRNWMQSYMTPSENGTESSGGFFGTLMDGIVSFSNEIAQNYNKNDTMKAEKKQRGRGYFNNWKRNENNSTGNWFSNWRNQKDRRGGSNNWLNNWMGI